MKNQEYKAIPAPTQGKKAKGVKTTPDRFALSLTEILNEMAGEGWTYVRAETLPCDERRGLTGTQTTFQNMLIFRRAVETEAEAEVAPAPQALPGPARLEAVEEIRDHDDADPKALELGDTLRATRQGETQAPATPRLGPARDDD